MTFKHTMALSFSMLKSHKPLIFNLQKSRKDVSNFDREFTSEAPKLTPTDKLFIMNLDQTEFAGFSFVNPEFIVSV